MLLLEIGNSKIRRKKEAVLQEILLLRNRPTNATLLVQFCTKLPDRHVVPEISGNRMPPCTIPRPAFGLPLEIILTGRPRIQRKGDTTQLRAPGHRIGHVCAEQLERLRGVVPDPQGIPEGVSEGFCVEREGLDG